MNYLHKAWLEALAAARAAELRAQRDQARYVFSPGHPTLAELHRQAELADAALRELRETPAQQVAA